MGKFILDVDRQLAVPQKFNEKTVVLQNHGISKCHFFKTIFAQCDKMSRAKDDDSLQESESCFNFSALVSVMVGT